MGAGKKMLELSFAGAGFLGVYQIGVARYLQQNLSSVEICGVGGSSSGSIVTCLLLDQYPARLMSLGPSLKLFLTLHENQDLGLLLLNLIWKIFLRNIFCLSFLMKFCQELMIDCSYLLLKLTNKIY